MSLVKEDNLKSSSLIKLITFTFISNVQKYDRFTITFSFRFTFLLRNISGLKELIFRSFWRKGRVSNMGNRKR